MPSSEKGSYRLKQLGRSRKIVTISEIKKLKGVGVLADKLAGEDIPSFRHFNLIYGFNGSGKSTLSDDTLDECVSMFMARYECNVSVASDPLNSV